MKKYNEAEVVSTPFPEINPECDHDWLPDVVFTIDFGVTQTRLQTYVCQRCGGVTQIEAPEVEAASLTSSGESNETN